MNRMSEWELRKLQGVGDRLIVDVTKPLHVADKILYLLVPIDNANCSLSDSQSHRIVGALTLQQEPAKQIRHQRWCADQLSDA